MLSPFPASLTFYICTVSPRLPPPGLPSAWIALMCVWESSCRPFMCISTVIHATADAKTLTSCGDSLRLPRSIRSGRADNAAGTCRIPLTSARKVGVQYDVCGRFGERLRLAHRLLVLSLAFFWPRHSLVNMSLFDWECADNAAPLMLGLPPQSDIRHL